VTYPAVNEWRAVSSKRPDTINKKTSVGRDVYEGLERV
jgi:hypothetical protein